MAVNTDVIVGRVRELIDANKAIAGFLAPFVGTVVAVIANWVSTNDFNGQEIRLAAGGLLVSLWTAFTVYRTKAGRAAVEPGR